MAEQGTLTYADLETFPDDGLRRELIDGDLIVSPSPKTRHQVLLGRLHLALGNHVAAHGGAQVSSRPWTCSSLTAMSSSRTSSSSPMPSLRS